MSSEDFKSFIVTNPDLVDESIDVSGLRTTTDTSPFLLGNIPDYGGIQYEAYNPNRLSDLMRLYSGGFPMLDTPQAAPDFTGGEMIDTGGGGGMDQATGGLDTTQPFQDLVDPDVNIDEFATEDTTMPSMLSPDMGASMVTDTTPINMSPLTSEQFVDTTSGLDDVDMNLIDQPFADTPVVLGSGNNALGLQDPQSLAIGPSGAVDFDTGGLEDYTTLTSAQAPVEQAPPGIMNPYDPSQSTILGQPGIDRFDAGEAGIDLDPSAGIEDIPVELPATNIETEFEPQAVNTILGPDGITYDAVTGNPIYEDLDAQAAATTLELNQIQDQPLRDKLSSSLTSATEGLSSVAELTGDKLEEIGTSIAAAVGGVFKPDGSTITVPGLGEINVKQTIGGMILNKVAGGPITLAFSALRAIGGMLPEGGRSDMSDALGEQYGMDDIGRLTGGPMAGYAVDSAFGKGIEQSTADVKNDVGNTLSGKYGFTQSELDQIAEGTYTGTKGYNEIMGTTTNLVDRYKDLSDMEKQIQRNKTAIDYDMEGTDEGDRAAEEDATADEAFADTGDYDVYAGGGADQDPVGPGFGNTDYADPGVDAEENQPDGGGNQDTEPTDGGFGNTEGPRGGGADMGSAPSSSPSTGRGRTDAQSQYGGTSYGGGGGGGGGGKIVCTMMNDSYGFGSFRNKIWLKHSKDLAPEYQIGYHKIFLPLVKLSKTNKVLKKTLEHIAVHRTIDIRQESRGKTHLLGRVYRKILEPICYIVGKYAK